MRSERLGQASVFAIPGTLIVAFLMAIAAAV